MINDINTFIEMWLNCDVLNHAYKYFNVYVSDSYDEKVRYYISPETLLKNDDVDNSGGLSIITRSFENVEYQTIVNRLMLEPKELLHSFMFDSCMKWGYSYKYYEASTNFEILYKNRFNDYNFKLIWLTIILNDLMKFSKISFLQGSNTYLSDIIEHLKLLLNDKGVNFPFLYMESKRQFIFHFNKAEKDVYKFDTLDDLLIFLNKFTLSYLLNYKFLVIAVGTEKNKSLDKNKIVVSQMIRDNEENISEQLTIDNLL